MEFFLVLVFLLLKDLLVCKSTPKIGCSSKWKALPTTLLCLLFYPYKNRIHLCPKHTNYGNILGPRTEHSINNGPHEGFTSRNLSTKIWTARSKDMINNSWSIVINIFMKLKAKNYAQDTHHLHLGIHWRIVMSHKQFE